MTAFRRAARVIAFTVFILGLALFGSRPAAQAPPPPPPRVFISEILPTGNNNGIYNADWFEVTNTGTTDVDITGWVMDDTPSTGSIPVLLTGVTTIPAGKSAIFLETATPATTISLFKTAWFGASPPADLLIGSYTGPGVGLSNGGDAVNLFNASGVLVTGVTFGAATATVTFDNTAGFGAVSVSTKSAIDINGAFLSANGVEVGSPGKRINATPLSTIDLSLYVRTDRFPLPEPTNTPPPPGSLLAQEASAVAYNWDTDTLFIVGDGSRSVVQVTKTGQLIDTMAMELAPGKPQGSEFYDTEGLTYVGNGNFVMSEERDRRAVMFKYVPGTTLTRALAKTVALGTFVDNIGLEGLWYDPQTGGFIFVKEAAPRGIFQTTIDFAAGTASNGSPTTENSTNLFDPALANLSDFADVFALSNLQSLTGPESTRLLLLSQEAARIVNIDRAGVVSNALQIVKDDGDALSAPDMQHEGLTMDWNGTLYVVNENGGGNINHPELWVYKKSTEPNLPPTAVALANQVNSIAENTSTASRIKVADVVVTDDGLGTNQISVMAGPPDAAAFEIFNGALYIKAGTVLDFETKNAYTITVVVDDTTVGATPDRTAPFTLNITDVANETPGGSSSLVISEVANWGSGVPSYEADWFEVTNTGASSISLTNWRMDDSSNAIGNSVALTGVPSIAPGESVIFMESSTPAAATAAFLNAWFGANPPPGLQVGTYSGPGVGLSTSMINEGVVLFDAGGNRITGISFTGGPANVSLDNRAGIGGNAAPFPSISTPSARGVGGAFRATDNHATGSPGTTAARLIISEVTPWANDDAPYQADWFEVTNTSPFPIDLTGWRMDDNSNSFSSGVPLRGVTSLLPGRSAVFIEGVADGSTDNALRNAFSNAWFGSTTPPPGLLIGFYGGAGVGLGRGGDNVNVFDGGGVRVTVIRFAGSTSPISFDNAAGISSSEPPPQPNIITLSALGVRGAFLAADGFEIGSPGGIAVAPASANGATVPPLGALVDGRGASWSLGLNKQIFRNGIAVGQGSKIAWFGGTIYVLGIDNNWWEWQDGRQRWVVLGRTSPVPAGAVPSASPEGTVIPPAARIVDELGNNWTLTASGIVLRNGGNSGGGGLKLLWTGGVVYAFRGDGNWWAWEPSTGTWARFGPLAPGLGTPPPTSADGATVPPLTQLVDAEGAVWTIGTNKKVLRNGFQAGTGLGSKLLWSGGVLYALGIDNNWWKWQPGPASWMLVGPTQP